MGFFAILTPRTGGGRPALILPPTQAKNRAAIHHLMLQAERQVALSEKKSGGGPTATSLQFSNCLGVSIPITTGKSTSQEIYLLGGVDTKNLTDEQIDEVYSRITSQIIPLADKVIQTAIPWQHRNSPTHRVQFITSDAVLRDELVSYGLIFNKLPETRSLRAEEVAKVRNRMLLVKVLSLLVFAGAGIGAWFWYPRDQPTADQPASRVQIKAPIPPPMPLPQPDPFANADLDTLMRGLEELQANRAALISRQAETSNSETRMKWECAAIRFNRKRNFLLEGFRRINVESGQSSLEPITIQTDAEWKTPKDLEQARLQIDEIRVRLRAKRSSVDLKELEQVEEFNDLLEWSNLQEEALKRNSSPQT